MSGSVLRRRSARAVVTAIVATLLLGLAPTAANADGVREAEYWLDAYGITQAWSTFAARRALPMSRLQIEPDRPYGVALARRSASSSVSNGMTETTGPKISSFAIRMSFDTPSKTVGRRYAPSARAGSSGAPPPTTIVAPSAWPISM